VLRDFLTLDNIGQMHTECSQIMLTNDNTSVEQQSFAYIAMTSHLVFTT